jgi:hypothetical protein
VIPDQIAVAVKYEERGSITLQYNGAVELGTADSRTLAEAYSGGNCFRIPFSEDIREKHITR